MADKESANAQWAEAWAHFDQTMSQYSDLPARSGLLALTITFVPLKRRYDAGERTEDLRLAMLAVE